MPEIDKPTWKEVKPAFIDKIIDMTYQHFPEKIAPCPDCGLMSLHICETAYRKQLDLFFEKVYQFAKNEEINKDTIT